ncbi:FAD-binding oxidoreductase [Cyanobium sp. T1B-Tous]|uniref:FAD-dependent oxidoreductase n=1 Tax=Cyanobium sp. T1B-Tous TaxID=2823721 RepID=UPI0020CBDE77|nr:FAD-dependent oxidoreductase [Cyanobium sp. T1B-Tous]MCP9807027.1 FAD-binding oxidoreductase [Cyanobium sp. T1B-Tous]
MTAPATAGVVIVGGGLAGSLLALALRARDTPVTVVEAPPMAPSGGGAVFSSATAISYGALPGWPLAPTPLARLAAGASRHWRRLQTQHGDLGWRRLRLRLQGGPAWWPLPFAQVDTATLASRLPVALEAAGVTHRIARVEQLLASAAPGWRLQLGDGTSLAAGQVVLAAGAGCRQLWPGLPDGLRSSWAAVLELPPSPLIQGRQAAWLPARFGRVALERRAADLSQPEWLVDGGLVPRGDGALLGQHTLVRPGLELGTPPPAGVVEEQLRRCLADQAWAAALAPLPGRLLQAPVAFCTQGLPLVGPLAEAPGLWAFTGFSAGFSQVPVLAPLLAQALVAGGDRAAAARRRLQQLGLGWSDPVGADRRP